MLGIPASRRTPKRSTRILWTGGFTATEVLVGITALGIMVGASSLGLQAITNAFSLDSGTGTISMALYQARVVAIARGHVVDVAFGPHSYTATDTEVGLNGEIISSGQMPSNLTLSSSGTASFTPLGTVAAPVVVTVLRGEDSKTVRVGLTGEVEIQ